MNPKVGVSLKLIAIKGFIGFLCLAGYEVLVIGKGFLMIDPDTILPSGMADQ